MANYNKSFNFRNGVQVDDDNFIVNANGLVGIGTSIPREFLDVHGTAKITGLVTATNLAISGVSTFYSDVKVGSGITFNPSTGSVRATAFFGNGSTLSNIVGFSTNAWILNIAQTGLSTSLNIGIGTQALDAYDLVIGSDPLVSEGISFDGSSGNVYSSGIVTASSFSGDLTGNITGNINSSGVSTFSTLKVGTGVTISGGIVTATSFVGSLTGTATTTTNIPNLTGAITSNNTTTSLGSFTSAQLATALSDETGSGANVFANSPTLVTPALGNATATSIVVSAGIITASGFNGTLTGNVVGIASTARDLTFDARVSIAHIASQTSSIGVSTVSTRLYAESIGVGTNSPSSDIHIRRSSTSRLQVTSDATEAIVAVGRSTTLAGDNGVLRFGNVSESFPYSTSNSFDLLNYGRGNINFYLEAGASGINTGSYFWHRKATSRLMTLTYDGKLGIGKTNPNVSLDVVGIITTNSDIFAFGNLFVNGDGNINGDVNIDGNLSANTITFPSSITVDVLDGKVVNSGLSTFGKVNVLYDTIVQRSLSVGLASAARDYITGGSLSSPISLLINSPNILTNVVVVLTNGSLGIGTGDFFVNGINSPNRVSTFGAIGVGTDGNYLNTNLCAVDFTSAGKGVFEAGNPNNPYANKKYMRVPVVNTAERDNFTGLIGGEIIYNITVNKHQGYNGSIWNNLY